MSCGVVEIDCERCRTDFTSDSLLRTVSVSSVSWAFAVYLGLCKISTTRQQFSVNANKTLICAFVLSRIDYSNSLFAGIPKYLLDRLKKKKNQNQTAHIVFKSPKHCLVSPLFRSQHWLPITKRIDYKLSSSCFSISIINGTGLKYLSELLTIYTLSQQLCSASDTRLFRIPSFRTKTNRQNSFSFQCATVWSKQTEVFFLSRRYCLEQSSWNC